MWSVPALAYSLGAKRFTPAAMQASMRFFWDWLFGSERSWMKERTVCVPTRAVARSSLLL
jgi:hypothetical protein